MKITGQLLAALIPVVILELTLFVIALADWLRRKKYRYLSKWIWLLILFFQPVGPIVYLLLNRGNE